VLSECTSGNTFLVRRTDSGGEQSRRIASALREKRI
jgi:hypothetical protein